MIRSNWISSLGAALAIIAFTWCVARGSVLAELRRNSTLPVPTWLYYWIRFVIPAVILVVLVFGWVDWFQNR